MNWKNLGIIIGGVVSTVVVNQLFEKQEEKRRKREEELIKNTTDFVMNQVHSNMARETEEKFKNVTL